MTAMFAEYIGAELLPEYGLKVESRQSSCEVVIEPRGEIELRPGVVEWIAPRLCEQATNGLEVWINGRRYCWAHVLEAVRADIARIYGSRPVHGLHAGLFNRARQEGAFGDELRLVVPGARTERPALIEGSLLDVYGER